MPVLGQTVAADIAFDLDQFGDLAQEPAVNTGDLVDVLDTETFAQGLGDVAQTIWCRTGEGRGQRVMAGDLALVETTETGFERTERLLQAFLEVAADGHGFADRFHGGRQERFGALVFLEGKARDLGDNVINRRLERGWRNAGNIIGQLVQGVADGELCGDLGDREAGRLRSQRGGPRDARIHLDHDEAAIVRVHSELHVGPAGLHTNLAQHSQRGIAHDLVFLVGQRQGWCDGDGVAGVDAHRVDILDRADDDRIVRLVADDLHLELFPAEQALVDKDLGNRGGSKARADDLFILFDIVGNAPARAAKREGGANDGGQADLFEDFHRFLEAADPVIADDLAGIVPDLGRSDDGGSWVFEADAVHGFAEEFAVFGHLDGIGARPDQLDAVLVQRSRLVEVERAIERGLSAHRGQERVRLFDLDDLFDKIRCDRLDIGRVRHVRIGHDGGRVGVDQDDPVAFRFQGLDGLHPGIVELAGLADNDRASANNENRLDVSTFRHLGSSLFMANGQTGAL